MAEHGGYVAEVRELEADLTAAQQENEQLRAERDKLREALDRIKRAIDEEKRP